MTDIRSTQELLPWITPISDGLVVCKDSSFLAAFEFFGADADTVGEADTYQVGQAIERMMAALRDLPITIWWTVRREATTDYPGERMPDDVSSMLDDEHRAQFLHSSAYVNRHFLSLIWMPEKSTADMFGKIGALMADGANVFTATKTAIASTYFGKSAFAWKAAEMDRAIHDFETKLDQVENIISSLNPIRLTGQVFMGFLWAQANPGQKMIPKTWNGVNYLDALLSEEPITVHRESLQFGDVKDDQVHVSTLSMKSWPSPLAFGAFDGLVSVPTEMVMSHCFRVMNTRSAQKHIENVKRINDFLKYPLKTWVIGAMMRKGEMSERNADPSRALAAEQAKEAKGVLNAGEVLFGYHNMTVAIVDRDLKRMEETTRNMKRMFNATPFTGVVRETTGLLSSWATTLPGQWQESKRWMALSSANMVDIAPLMGVHAGYRYNQHLTEQLGTPCQALTVLATDYNTPFYFNFHVGALGHAMVLGPSRSGKSIGMNFLISQFRKYGRHSKIIIFDKDYSCRIPTLLQGGEHIDLRGGGVVRLNPMLLVRDRRNWAFLANWVEELISSRGHTVTSEDSKAIFQAVEGTAANPSEVMHRLHTVRTLLPTHLGVHLDAWVGTGQYANYFDNVEDSFNLSSFTCMEMGEIMKEPRVARAFMDYAFYRIQRALEAQRTSEMNVTMVYVEECWFLLDDPYFAAKLKDWLKTFAKLNAFLVLTTQSIEDLEALPASVFAAVRDNIQTKIFLPNANALTEKLSEFYRKNFDLRPDLIQRIATGVPKQDYIVVQPEVARKVRLQLTTRQVAALRSDIAAQRVFERHYAERSPGWEARYINEMTK